MIKLYEGGTNLVDVNFTAFPDGQPHINLPYLVTGPVRVVASITGAYDLFCLHLLNDVLRDTERSLEITYLMGARMDRAIDARHPFTLAVVAEQIRSMGFSYISVLDPHSEVSVALLRAEAQPATKFAIEAVDDFEPDFLLCPDLGASKRLDALANRRAVPVLHALKQRDVNTGIISGTTVLESNNLMKAQILIVDDLCDGGATFVALGKYLKARRKVREVALYVTHGVFSKGLPLRGIDHVYTTNSYADHESTDYLTVFPV